jgi:hypothetical protein
VNVTLRIPNTIPNLQKLSECLNISFLRLLMLKEKSPFFMEKKIDNVEFRRVFGVHTYLGLLNYLPLF